MMDFFMQFIGLVWLIGVTPAVAMACFESPLHERPGPAAHAVLSAYLWPISGLAKLGMRVVSPLLPNPAEMS